MTTTWEIFDVKRQIADGLVVRVSYVCTARLGNSIEREVGNISLTGDISSSDFIPFSELTQEEVVRWVKASLGETVVDDIETAVQQSVVAREAAKAAETLVSGFPWE